MFLEVANIERSFGSECVLDGVSFAVTEGEVVSIVGPSGVGKTTLLHLLAGLDEPDAGSIRFATQPAKEHPVILVFQDYVLFPNMTVFENVAFGLKVRRLPARQIHAQVRDMLGWFGLSRRQDHYPAQLSAGQRQRVAIARAMIVNPMLLLLDEPFANLDRGLKMQTAEFIRDTQKKFGVTTIAVTHDLEEAFVMSDRIGLMLGGRLVQYDKPQTVYAHPVDKGAAAFLGPVNILDARLRAALSLPGSEQGDVFVRPESLRLVRDHASRAVVTSVAFAGHYSKYTVSIDDHSLLAYGRFATINQGDRVRVVIRDHHAAQGT